MVYTSSFPVWLLQIIVYSFPFLPSFTQIMRAVCKQHSDNHSGTAADPYDGHQGTGTVNGYTIGHMEQRMATLSVHQQCWWEEMPSVL